ncbi:MlaE family ABC transporter permease [Pseudazoarcus pumilus]|uniref:ABC transporter permease n=1 Tax=Pseudazoarcus pumilus TaxID=2067960 RepID=A0A2I6S4C0_9RHOO|nr:ABC transporter permease [Pseudazoarcus pumilus]AUN94110.1 ABC transporter permease [Pseudazoarcus pumilus]
MIAAADAPGTSEIVPSADGPILRIAGAWTLPHCRALAAHVAALRERDGDIAAVDASGLSGLDTAGAGLLCTLLSDQQLETVLAAQAPERQALLRTVREAHQRIDPSAQTPDGYMPGDILEHIGRTTVAFRDHLVGVCGLLGLTLETFARTLFRPGRWRMTSFVAHLERTGLDALPIVALLTFLVGAVVAFLGATVLTGFGASIYTVDLVAYSFLREFGVLLAAILVAGRTSSAFAAQIGSMRANEEVDAIRVLGLSPVELLVLPRVLALLVALPILAFVAMISGLAGGMIVCALKLDISPSMFLSVIETNVALRHFLIGMAKAPVFAFLIAVIGCNEGFRAGGSAQSVGEHTTSAVVQSIFVVIVVDAIAALFCMEMGW